MRFAREQTIATSDRASEDEHWERTLETDFGKLGVEDADEFFRLCTLRYMPVPRERKSDYRWLRYQRAEKLKEWAPEDHRALLNAHADAQLERRPTAREMRRFRQR
jgi:hypothetical protein